MSLPKPYYQDGSVTIYHGDAVEIMREIPAGSIDVLWTDPPFGHSNHDGDFNARLNEHRKIESQPIANDDMASMRTLVDAILTEAVRVLNPVSCCCCCCCCCCGGGGPKPTFAWLANRMDAQGMSFFHSVIWDKLNPGLGWRFRRQHEMVMVAHPAKAKLLWADNDRAIPNIFECMPPRDRLHPNEKPEELVGYFLGAIMPENTVVLDPCMGSGTTLRVAKNLNRRAIGIDLEEKWCEIAAKRMGQEVLNLT